MRSMTLKGTLLLVVTSSLLLGSFCGPTSSDDAIIPPIHDSESCGCSGASRSAMPDAGPTSTSLGEAEHMESSGPCSSSDREACDASSARESSQREGVDPAPSPCGSPVRIPAGAFVMGTNRSIAIEGDGEGPARVVMLDYDYEVDPCEVTNAQYRAFVRATKHRGAAEQYGWSMVPNAYLDATTLQESSEIAVTPWWYAVTGACWRAPEGPRGAGINDRLSHPVVHVSYDDAAAFCAWRGMRLPTEEEYEKAARGGRPYEDGEYPWGLNLTGPTDTQPHAIHHANLFQGQFFEGGRSSGRPVLHNIAKDGYVGSSPVGSFPPNGFGLYDAVGNVWEWTTTLHKQLGARQPVAPRENGEVVHWRVMKGGSFLCHRSYCRRFRPAARSGLESDSSTYNLGLRCYRTL